VIVRHIGLQPYEPVFESMKRFTDARTEKTVDELWFLEHEPIYTQGRAGKSEYVVSPGDIPVIDIDRGGQVTYHGPGQLTVYTLIDIKRLGIGVRDFVSLIESALVLTLARWNVKGVPRADAPGVYVDGAKIGALGLRIKQGRSYHGLNFNIDMDMRPWSGINACGLGGEVTQLREQVPEAQMPDIKEVASVLLEELTRKLGAKDIQTNNQLPF
jgi:lipoyl(octanoyl) transferase